MHHPSWTWDTDGKERGVCVVHTIKVFFPVLLCPGLTECVNVLGCLGGHAPAFCCWAQSDKTTPCL